MPAPGQPQPRALRSRPVRAASAAPTRTDQAQADPRHGTLHGADAARHRGEHRQPARATPPLPGCAAHRDRPPGVFASQPPRQGQGLGGPLLRPEHDRRLVIRDARLHLAVVATREEPMRKLWTAFLILVTAGLAGCGYNDMQRADEQTKAAWSEVLNQYQRRADL